MPSSNASRSSRSAARRRRWCSKNARSSAASSAATCRASAAAQPGRQPRSRRPTSAAAGSPPAPASPSPPGGGSGAKSGEPHATSGASPGHARSRSTWRRRPRGVRGRAEGASSVQAWLASALPRSRKRRGAAWRAPPERPPPARRTCHLSCCPAQGSVTSKRCRLTPSRRPSTRRPGGPPSADRSSAFSAFSIVAIDRQTPRHKYAHPPPLNPFPHAPRPTPRAPPASPPPEAATAHAGARTHAPRSAAAAADARAARPAAARAPRRAAPLRRPPAALRAHGVGGPGRRSGGAADHRLRPRRHAVVPWCVPALRRRRCRLRAAGGAPHRRHRRRLPLPTRPPRPRAEMYQLYGGAPFRRDHTGTVYDSSGAPVGGGGWGGGGGGVGSCGAGGAGLSDPTPPPRERAPAPRRRAPAAAA
jgi:hypothetical protein